MTLRQLGRTAAIFADMHELRVELLRDGRDVMAVKTAAMLEAGKDAMAMQFAEIITKHTASDEPPLEWKGRNGKPGKSKPNPRTQT